MNSKMTELYILCWDTGIGSERQFSLEKISKMTESYILCGDISTSNWKRQFSVEIISKMTEPYILCQHIKIPTEKDSSVTKSFQRWQNLTSVVGTFKSQLKITDQSWNDFRDDRTLLPLLGESKSISKRQFGIEMISKMTEPYILCGNMSNLDRKRQFSIEMISKMTEPYILCLDISNPNWQR